MKKYCILAILCCFSYLAAAQTPVEKGLESINRASAEAYIGFLAHDELQGREAGYHGSKVAAQYIASLLQAMGVQPLGDNYFQPFEAYRRERQKKGRLEVHPDSIALFSKEVHQKLPMTNVLGIIPGKNVNEYAIVGAHFDHLGIDPALDGDQIINGAVTMLPEYQRPTNSQSIHCQRETTGKKYYFCFLGWRRERIAGFKILCTNLPVHFTSQGLSEFRYDRP